MPAKGSSIEPLDLTLLTEPERKQYQQATNLHCWLTLNRKQRCDLKRKYHVLIDKYTGGGRKKEIEQLLQNKWEQLMQNSKTGNVLTDEQKIDNILTGLPELKIGHVLTDLEEPPKARFNHLGKELNCSGSRTLLKRAFLINSTLTTNRFGSKLWCKVLI